MVNLWHICHNRLLSLKALKDFQSLNWAVNNFLGEKQKEKSEEKEIKETEEVSNVQA